MKVALIDGYLDEPSCLGVPPYVSPHIRYTYGALLAEGVTEDNITYLLIDQIRNNKAKCIAMLQEVDIVIIIAGTTVPGRYLGGRPISLREIAEVGQQTPAQVVLGGPILQSLSRTDIEHWKLDTTIDVFSHEIAAITVHELIRREPFTTEYLPNAITNWSVLGARLTKKHPHFPYIICELETFRGCPRPTNCSFCSERLKKVKYCRLPQDIVEEVDALYRLGNRYFRLGCQTDLLSFGATLINDNMSPNVPFIKELYSGIRQVAPDLKVLHMDNINPSTIVREPKLAADILSSIVAHNTTGDVAAFGLESADPEVLVQNNINTNPKEVFKAVKIMNRIGGIRVDGVPKLLPGLNLLHGLVGESSRTMRMNYDFLQEILDAGLLLRRINIRQVQEVQGYKAQRVNAYKFQQYKKEVNEKINLPMLQQVFPIGTILNDVLTEKKDGNVVFGRQLGSYPILIGIPGEYSLRSMLNVRVIGHGYRSITALPYPFNVNSASLSALETLPGVGKKRARRIFLSRPIQSLEHLNEVLDNTIDTKQFREWVSFIN